MSQKNDFLLKAYELGYKVDKKGHLINPNGKVLKGSRLNNYIQLNLRKDNLKRLVAVHRLQAYQKYGNKIFEKGIQVRHKNGNPLDNSWDNILIGTGSENQMDIPEEKRIERASNPQHNHEKVIKDHEDGMSYKEIMEKHNISSKGTVSFIINKSLKRTYSTVG